MNMVDLNAILEKSKTISDISRYIYGNAKYHNREKTKKYLKDNNIDYQEWQENKKNEQKKFCLFCGKELVGRDRYRKKFCNSSCSASYNNIGVVRNGEKASKQNCLNCGKETINKQFCSHTCRMEYKNKIFIEDWQNGKTSGVNIDGSLKTQLRNYLLQVHDYKCESCGFSGTNQYTGNSILQIHHIDGNVYNDRPDNLQVLCPNCHALTENFGSRNKNSTRVDRRTKYYYLSQQINDE